MEQRTPDTDDDSTDSRVTLTEQLATLRAAIVGAQAAVERIDRHEYVKDALGECVDLAARREVRVADLKEQLVNVLVSPDEEAAYFLNQAEARLEALEERHCAAADDRGPDPDADEGPHIDLSGEVDIPHIDPTDDERDRARAFYGPEAVPDEGPIPDPRHSIGVDVTVTIPEWALEAVRWRLEPRDDVGEYDPAVYLNEVYVTPDGEPVRDAVRDED